MNVGGARYIYKKCLVCGEGFLGGGNAKFCPACREKIHSGEIDTVSLLGQIERRRKVYRKSQIEERLREAAYYGLSYGKYVALRAAGFPIQRVPKHTYVNPSLEDWMRVIYQTVAECKARTLRQKGLIRC